ncbi:MAG TPA: amidase family protein [Thermomicrobiales bacterium]|jgi:aspartyl-tRNA(Asn)/glutamyl-tRNA(Gln) amidotransferase subunit A
MEHQRGSDLCYLSALELRQLYTRRELSPVEVTAAILARIERLNPHLNAFLTVTAARAMAEARAAERAFARTDAAALPPLTGIPVSIKDNQPTKGIRTTHGSLVTKDAIPDHDSLVVARTSAAGAILLGKTNLPEDGWKGGSSNRLGPPVQNPWRAGYTTGGSSAGAAAAVAAGLGPIAQGGDGAGSIRIPAGFCGVFGFKPSFGLIAYRGASAASTAHVGPLTRTVRDAALFLDSVAGADPRDRFSFNGEASHLDACGGGIAGLRVAWSPDLGYAAIDPEVRELTARAAARFTGLGCHVEEADPGLPDPWDILDPIWCATQAAYYFDNFDAVRDQLDPGRLPIIERGFNLSAAALCRAQSRRTAFHGAVCAFMEPYDLLITPQLPITAFPADQDAPTAIAGRAVSYLGWSAFTYPFNLTGQPAAAIPCGFASDGLPIALQLVGRWRDDTTVLRAAAAYEALAPWAQRPPVERLGMA